MTPREPIRVEPGRTGDARNESGDLRGMILDFEGVDAPYSRNALQKIVGDRGKVVAKRRCSADAGDHDGLRMHEQSSEPLAHLDFNPSGPGQAPHARRLRIAPTDLVHEP